MSSKGSCPLYVSLCFRKIIAARKAVGLSQAALARKAGIRVETLNRLEKGKHTPDLATMAKINKALDDAGAPG
jgi:transcriptional regulator with XRE-family HTH domain